MLSGKTAIVTGGSAGIGKAIAAEFLEQGASVVIANRSEETGKETAEELGCSFIQCDVSSYESVESLVEQTVEEYGELDILVNNAGIGMTGTVETTPLEDWHKLMEINLNGVVYGTRAAMPYLQESSGTVLNVASVFGLVGGPQTAAYATAKGAVVNFTRTTAVDYAEEGVRVNSICPGFVETEMTESELEADSFYEFVLSQTPINRIARVEEIAEPAAFLVSEKASYITGTNLSIDGGWTTH
ncbi:NAD(P)-dependent dehydrogenase (short-subunit alcohol dehydrogenase family) [Halorubrum alkaliphilum]|uniref:NAD(P)-dependent dehydrogenase (Short-subunit alcohol dehydrogenase family) n=1 Tax=Halorubrum alkaliphilum TaxID=261290 RepID=A0A8T4GDH6_9EURY|nr:glucose 1-dehydrogenase [Halorubrum alkaliphilum]MBP1922163.1 NAD(P)-dependent dehydrogenase (short-subunit alcohol dehydrogenase family) [Halorubrum alkaliphilum]